MPGAPRSGGGCTHLEGFLGSFTLFLAARDGDDVTPPGRAGVGLSPLPGVIAVLLGSCGERRGESHRPQLRDVGAGDGESEGPTTFEGEDSLPTAPSWQQEAAAGGAREVLGGRGRTARLLCQGEGAKNTGARTGHGSSCGGAPMGAFVHLNTRANTPPSVRHKYMSGWTRLPNAIVIPASKQGRFKNGTIRRSTTNSSQCHTHSQISRCGRACQG